MTHFLFTSLLLLSGFAASFRPSSAPPATGREARTLPDFTRVALTTAATVVVHQGSPQQVVVEAAPAVLARLQTTVHDGQLLIHNKATDKWQEFWKNRPRLGAVTIHITVPVIWGLAVRSSGHLTAEGFQSGKVNLAVSGSGGLRVGPMQATVVRTSVTGSGRLVLAELRADTLLSSTTGSGSLTVAGVCRRFSLSVQGSGNIRAAELATETCRARLSGSGGCQVQVARQLDARLSGSGAVWVKGPAQISSHTSGSGRVRRG